MLLKIKMNPLHDAGLDFPVSLLRKYYFAKSKHKTPMTIKAILKFNIWILSQVHSIQNIFARSSIKVKLLHSEKETVLNLMFISAFM